MNDFSPYPNFNDHPQGGQTILGMYGDTPLGELIWAVIPLIILALALIIR